ncbi:MAG: hypothetical protein ACR2HN_06190 [Tepidiformaceae bacterium]
MSWETLVSAAGNPRIPALGEVLDELFTAEEAARYERHLRPSLERDGRAMFSAGALLKAVKPGRAGG